MRKFCQTIFETGLLITALFLMAILGAVLTGCAEVPQKPSVKIIQPVKIAMCADKTPSGTVHISPCDPREGDPK
jgi:hypothetical protein